jgi:ZIP family zinc transporter
MISLVWGAVAGSALLLGALVSLLLPVEKKTIGWIMAFGTGVLIGAAVLELLQDSVSLGGIRAAITGALTGALLFTVADILIHKKGGGKRKQSGKNPPTHSGLAIFIGTVIDAIPESIIIGTGLVKGSGVSFVMVIAVFISNFPEGLSSTAGLLKDGYSKTKILLLWLVVLLLAALSSFFGYSFLEDSKNETISFISAFAAGGIMAMVSSTMMPEAFEEGGPIVGLITTTGLLTALVLHHLS